MDIRALSRIVLLLFLAGYCHSVYAQDSCCAVAGAVKVKVWESGKQVERSPKGVKVTVSKHPDITYTVDNDEGVYVLHMPGDKIKEFELVFKLDGFPDDYDTSTNKERNNKRPIKKLLSINAIARGESSIEVQARAIGYFATLNRANAEGDSELAKSMIQNLEMLKSAGHELGAAAMESSARGETSEANFLFERALIFQELLDPQSTSLALTYENYAGFLRRQQTSAANEKAEALSQRASLIRTGKKNFDSLVIPYAAFKTDLLSDLTRPTLGTVHIPSSQRFTFSVPVTDRILAVLVVGADKEMCSLNVINKPGIGMKPQWRLNLYGGEGVIQLIEPFGVYTFEIINRGKTPGKCLIQVK